jgi:hypothetical protein
MRPALLSFCSPRGSITLRFEESFLLGSVIGEICAICGLSLTLFEAIARQTWERSFHFGSKPSTGHPGFFAGGQDRTVPIFISGKDGRLPGPV